MESILKASFDGDRGSYYVELLQEAGMDIDRVKLDLDLGRFETAEESDGGFNWVGLTIGLSVSLIALGLAAMGVHHYYKSGETPFVTVSRWYQERKQRNLLATNELDLEKGDYAIRLQYTNDEIEVFPGSTVGSSSFSDEHLSVPNLVKGEEEGAFTPGGSKSTPAFGGVSPLDSPQGSKKSTRYVSVFTVKKDCGGKKLEEIDLRALAIAYLSRMLKKFPNTHLLPYDKNAPLPAITNIRDIPDDLEELQQYVGNARIDSKTGKVLFNLRVESDEPVSKMKSSGSVGSRGSGKFKGKIHKVGATRVKSMDEMEQQEMPKSPGTFENVQF